MILPILLLALIIVVLVLAHEFGHFIIAKRNGVDVEEFGFGFGPRLASKMWHKTLYTFNLLPLGGFVRLKGEDSQDKGKGTFAEATFKAKTQILLAGVAANFAIAYVLLVLLSATRLPTLLPNQFSLGSYKTFDSEILVGAVAEGSPAEAAGLKTGIRIISIDGQSIKTTQDLLSFTKSHAGQKVNLLTSNNGKQQSYEIKLRSSEQAQLGVSPVASDFRQYGIISAPVVAAGLSFQLTWATVKGLVLMIVPHSGSGSSVQVAGPVGMAVILRNLIELGWAYILVFVISISISLGVINALPIPALDGGRLFIGAIQERFKNPMSQRTEAIIHTVGFVAILLLAGLITYFDIRRL